MTRRQSRERGHIVDLRRGLEAAQSFDLRQVRVDGDCAEPVPETPPSLVNAAAATDVDQHELRVGGGLSEIA
jgi:hypothetical protein